MRLPRSATAFVCGAVFLLCAPARVDADAVESFYKGRKVQFVIGYTAGGAYDLYARVLARHLTRHLPGQPTFIAQNMPGAGSLKAANYLYAVAPQDGSAIGMIGRGLAMEPLIGDARYDSRNFAWIGSITSEVSVCATWATAPVKRLADMFTHELTVGGEGSGSDPDVFALLLRNVFGARIKLVSGYPGGAEINLAMERGEVHGRCGWSWSSIKSRHPAWLRDRKLNVLLQFALQEDKALADVPSVMELARTEEQTEILKLVLGRQIMGRPVLAPPGTPEDRRRALRSAFDATMKDPEFIAEAEKAELEISPVTGAEIDRLLAELYRTPKDVLDKASRALK